MTNYRKRKVKPRQNLRQNMVWNIITAAEGGEERKRRVEMKWPEYEHGEKERERERGEGMVRGREKVRGGGAGGREGGGGIDEGGTALITIDRPYVTTPGACHRP